MLKHLLGARVVHKLSPVGYITWYLTDLKTGRIHKHGKSGSIIVNNGRIGMANLILGNTPNLPNFIGLGTGTNAPAATDTALQTISQYDGSNDNKQVASRFLVSTFQARFGVQFTTTEGNITIREIGLFDAANTPTIMWARVAVNITKTSASRLSVFWHITFERDTDVALKSGTSIGATGTLIEDADSTLTFASVVTLLRIENNDIANNRTVYIKLNGAMSGTPPTSYDFIVKAGQAINLFNDEIEISTVHAYLVAGAGGNITLPDNLFVCVGW